MNMNLAKAAGGVPPRSQTARPDGGFKRHKKTQSLVGTPSSRDVLGKAIVSEMRDDPAHETDFKYAEFPRNATDSAPSSSVPIVRSHSEPEIVRGSTTMTYYLGYTPGLFYFSFFFQS